MVECYLYNKVFFNCGMDVTCVKLENLIYLFFKTSTCVIRRGNYWNEIEIYDSLIRLFTCDSDGCTSEPNVSNSH